MAIPDYVHPFRLMLACFGLDPRKPLPRRGLMLQLVSSKFELPPTTATKFIDDLRDRIGPMLIAMATGSEFLLNMDATTKRLFATFENLLDEVGRSAADDSSSVLGTWIESSLRVDRQTFDALFRFSLGRLQVAVSRPGARQPALVELDRLCNGLIMAAPEAFRAAHRAVFEESGTPAVRQRLQASLYPLHHLAESHRHEEADERSAALLDRLRAWEDAAETSIYDVVRFMWAISTYQPSRDEIVTIPRAPDRRAVIHAAITWCEENSLPFPFRRDLYDIQEALARKRFTFTDSAVLFLDETGQTFATLAMDEATAVIERDVFLATHFGAALSSAEFRYPNLLGRFDAAWATAKSRIPDLELMTVDVHSIRPDLRRLDRWPYFTPRYFGVLRVGGASLWARNAAVAEPIEQSLIAPSPVTILDGPLMADFEKLLSSLFAGDPEELLRYLHHQQGGATLVASLPLPTVGMAKLTHRAVAKLLADGRLNAAFFAGLMDFAPRRAQEIDAMRRRVFAMPSL